MSAVMDFVEPTEVRTPEVQAAEIDPNANEYVCEW
jgi:hypothetical protein